MNASDHCDLIIKHIKESNLHYILSENAFSVEIKIKKKFIKQKSASSSDKILTVLNGLNLPSASQTLTKLSPAVQDDLSFSPPTKPS